MKKKIILTPKKKKQLKFVKKGFPKSSAPYSKRNQIA